MKPMPDTIWAAIRVGSTNGPVKPWADTSSDAEVPPDLLRRYFIHGEGRYRINKAIRDLCIFARQDLTRDPPFSRLVNVVISGVEESATQEAAVAAIELRKRGFVPDVIIGHAGWGETLHMKDIFPEARLRGPGG